MALFARAGKPQFDILKPDHAAVCAELHAGAFLHGWAEIEFERLLTAPTSFGDGAFDRGTPIGFILSRAAADEAEVLTLVVAPRWRKRGIAGGLLARHLGRLAAAGTRALFLEVSEDNVPARALYKRAGFAEAGRRKAYYATPAGGTRADALILRKSLD